MTLASCCATARKALGAQEVSGEWSKHDVQAHPARQARRHAMYERWVAGRLHTLGMVKKLLLPNDERGHLFEDSFCPSLCRGVQRRSEV